MSVRSPTRFGASRAIARSGRSSAEPVASVSQGSPATRRSPPVGPRCMRRWVPDVRVAFVYRNLNLTGSLERDSVFLLEGLARRGVELHCYCDPATSVDVDGVVRHHVEPLTHSCSRLGFPLLRWSFASRATKDIRAERSEY